MPPFTLIIYDFDGVVVDSLPANIAFYNQILAHFGLPAVTPEHHGIINTLTAPQVLERLFQGTPWRQAAQEYLPHVDNRPLLPLFRLMPYVRETLAQLRPRYALALATNRGRSLPLVMEHLGLTGSFDFTISSAEVQHPKPHPEVLQRVLSHFQAPPEAAIYIGDSAVDQEVATRAGVPFLAYKNPTLPARHHLQDHRQLLPWLGRLIML